MRVAPDDHVDLVLELGREPAVVPRLGGRLEPEMGDEDDEARAARAKVAGRPPRRFELVKRLEPEVDLGEPAAHRRSKSEDANVAEEGRRHGPGRRGEVCEELRMRRDASVLDEDVGSVPEPGRVPDRRRVAARPREQPVQQGLVADVKARSTGERVQ